MAMEGSSTVSSDDASPVRLTAWVEGRVQGVGFRWWTRCRGRELGLVGEARNLPDGRVVVVAEGDRRSCQRLLELLQRSADTPGRVDRVIEQWGASGGGFTDFREV
jgi:acylphosphatase